MKKASLLFLLAALCSVTFANTEVTKTENVANDGDKPSYNFYKNYSHWSIAVSGGFDLFLGERVDPVAGEKPSYYKDNFLYEFNAEVEYSVNPAWGFALNYAYAPISRKAIFMTKQTTDVNPESNAPSHQAYVMFNVNLLNLFRRYRSHSDWGWYAGVGAGAVVYNTSKEMFNPVDGQTLPWNVTAMIPLESRLEYSPISSLGIFLKAGLDFYLSDQVNVCSNGQLCDWNLYGGIGLRWNIGASKKESVRTIDMNTYEGGVARRSSSKDDDEEEVKQAKQVENPASEEQLAELQRQIDRLQAQITNLQNAPAATAVASTATSEPSSVDQNRLAKVENLANTNADDIKGIKSDINSIRKLAMMSNGTDLNSVYFADKSCLITSEYEIVLARVAKIMLADTSLKLEITSFCSKSGDAESNKVLGEKRIDAVRYILVNRYRIDQNRVITHYSGQVDDQFDSVNRRCDLTFK